MSVTVPATRTRREQNSCAACVDPMSRVSACVDPLYLHQGSHRTPGRTRARRTLASGATHHFERFRLRSTRKHTNHIRVMSKLKVPRVVSIRKQASEVHEARGVCVTIADPALSCPILPLGRRLRLYQLPLGRRWSGRTRCIAARRCSAARRGGWRPLPLGCG